METVPVFGCADFFLSLNKDRFAVFFPGEEKFYTGKTTDENPFALLKIPVPAGDIVPILTGNVRSIVSDESLKIEGCVEEDLYRIDAFSENGEIRSLWIEPSSFNVVRMEVKKSGLISCIASFENYVCEKHMAYPKEVRIVVRGPEYALVEVKYLTAKISDDDEDAKLFELQSPPGIVPTVIE
jgi:hypothetical protein